MELLIDCETYSERELKGTESVGSHKYANDPSTEVILWAVRARDWPTALVFEEPDLFKVLKDLKSSNRIEWTKNKPLILIHWSSFDRLVVNKGLDGEWDDAPEGVAAIAGPENTYWVDLQNTVLTYGGPAKLEDAATYFGGAGKQKGGAELISRFCKPKANGERRMPDEDPVRWQEFRSYAGRDVDAMLPVLELFEGIDGGHHPLEHWWRQTLIDRMGERGIPIDTESCAYTLQWMDRVEEDIKQDCFDEFGFVPTQTAKLKAFLGTPNTQKETIAKVIAELPDTDPRHRAAKYRRDAGGAARKKIKPMLLRQEQGRVYGAFQYHAAWTSRLASYGVQFQNFVREPYNPDWFTFMQSDAYHDDQLMEEVRNNIRGYLKAPEGRVLIGADYNAIECRTAAWLAGERWLLKTFEEGGDPYLAMASDMFGEQITDKKDPRRQEGKTVELGSLYQLGPSGKYGDGGLVGRYAANGMSLTHDRAQEIINLFRRKHPMIVSLWGYCQDAFAYLVEAAPGSQIAVGRLRFERWTNFIKVVRPSGLAQYYWQPHFREGAWPDGRPKIDLCYVGRTDGGNMVTKSTYGGDIFQGANQGTAADLLFHGMSIAEQNGFPPIIQAHDEMVAELEANIEDVELCSALVDELCRLLCIKPDWADGLPVEAEGYYDTRFTKV